MKVEGWSERQIEIGSAAADLFCERGYAATTMRDLAARVGMEAASLYNHFPSKAAMLRSICFEIGQQFIDGLQKAEQLSTPELQLREMLRAHILLLRTETAAAAVANEEWRHLKGDDFTSYELLRRRYESGIETIVQNGIQAGVFKALPPRVVRNTILSGLRWLQRGNRSAKLLEPEAMSHALCDWLMGGLLVP